MGLKSKILESCDGLSKSLSIKLVDICSLFLRDKKYLSIVNKKIKVIKKIIRKIRSNWKVSRTNKESDY